MDYYYLDKDMHQVGPMSLDDLVAAGINGDTMVWREGMDDWAKAGTLPDVVKEMEREALAAKAPKTPKPKQAAKAGDTENTPVDPAEAAAPDEKPARAAAVTTLDDELPPMPSKRLGMNILWMALSTINMLWFLGFILVVPFGIMGITFGAIGERAYEREDWLLARRFGALGRGFSIATAICGLCCVMFELYIITLINSLRF